MTHDENCSQCGKPYDAKEASGEIEASESAPSFETKVLETLESIDTVLWEILRAIEKLPQEQR